MKDEVSNFKNKFRRILFVVMLVFSSFVQHRSSFAAVDSALVAKAEKYLNSITGLTGDFAQTANGKTDSGVFSMLRPGRVRLDYKKTPIQLIADGKDLYFFDRDLDQITTVPLNSTPAGILIRKKIDLKNADIVVSDTHAGKGDFTLDMHLKDAMGLGRMSVSFNDNPVKLKSWVVTDATGTKTEVSFSGLKTKADFGKDYFQIQRHKTQSTGGGDKFYE
ncbi:MAG: outer membrane lipoprotein carrier protein LolA [Rickettsiales bacterium]|jgi:outer membrane lipoprotein-sorting protein|nr:outer membrane lipoprotein carrier protein LolA [Rickettsiales bacterium]